MNFYAIVEDGKNTPLYIWNNEKTSKEFESMLVFHDRKMANEALTQCIKDFPEARIIEVKIEQV